MRPGIVFPPLLPEKGLAKLQQEEQSIRKHAGHAARTWLQLLWGCPAFFFLGGVKRFNSWQSWIPAAGRGCAEHPRVLLGLGFAQEAQML